jgi:hypothetical protein
VFFLKGAAKALPFILLDEEKQKSKKELQNIYNTRPPGTALIYKVPTNLLTQGRLTQGDTTT